MPVDPRQLIGGEVEAVDRVERLVEASCSTVRAPISAEVTRGSRNTQAIAICARLWPRASAMSLSARTCAMVCSVISDPAKEPFLAARASFGTPLRYLFDSSPWASGEKAMQPTPSSASVPSSSSSIQRLSIE